MSRFVLVKGLHTFAIPLASIVEVAALAREQVKLSYLRTVSVNSGRGAVTAVEELRFEACMADVVNALNSGEAIDLEQLRKKCVEQRSGSPAAPEGAASPPETDPFVILPHELAVQVLQCVEGDVSLRPFHLRAALLVSKHERFWCDR
jgi:hypothetical protein